MEPLLGPVDLTRIDFGEHPGRVLGEAGVPDRTEMFRVVRNALLETGGTFERLDWVIVGGESGPGFRRIDEAWALDLMRQCAEAGVSFHFKQWSGLRPHDLGRLLDGREHNGMPEVRS